MWACFGSPGASVADGVLVWAASGGCCTSGVLACRTIADGVLAAGMVRRGCFLGSRAASWGRAGSTAFGGDASAAVLVCSVLGVYRGVNNFRKQLIYICK